MNQTNNNISKSVAEIVDQVIDDLSLEDRVIMANLEDDQIEFINKLIADYIQTKLNESLIKKGEMDLTEPEAIVKEVWNRLRETHKLRVVK
jgi:ribosomal protein S13